MTETKIAVVTGGEKGIGRTIVERLYGNGWHVVVAGVDEQALYFLERDFRGDRRLQVMPCDVSDERSVRMLFQVVRNDLGRLDALVLNAGIASPDRVSIEELSIEHWQRVLDVNLTGPFLCVKYAADVLKKSHGSIVAIGSTRSSMSEPDTFAYTASKGGLVSLAHSLAVSLGPDVRVNSVSPGWIHDGDYSELTPQDHAQHPVGRVGHPDDVSGLVSYLLGSESGFVTGQDFVVDGGMTKKMIYED